ncbi:5'/3'-nucleotidase SurE [Hydrogenovibrio kuenenii]|uniref:5'/3'-nucleotidase SurE n=1 Tax=Hydrogenovibrio kuenenii TaxID=63658 RepID=UPI00046386CC|nr:5'/3'-nucleotidase SurE [Hydrogenovibrio kuenenii]
MKILLSNDDGYNAPGIRALYECLNTTDFHSEMIIVAPDRNRSAASNSLTLTEPLRMSQQDDPHIFCVNGTPTDCVHLAVNGALDYQPDMVISGINAGANMGDDVLYSGTVAAATEGRFLGKPSIAISLCGDRHFDTASEVLKLFLKDFHHMPLDSETILNINVPDIPLTELKGIKMTRLGKRHCSERVVKNKDPRGNNIYWIGPAGDAEDASEGTDFYAVENGYASVTPLKIDLTHYDMLNKLSGWFN